MARKPDVPDEVVTVADLAERWILTDEAAKRLVHAAGVPSIGTPAPGRLINWDNVRFHLDAIRRWEADHQIVYRPSQDAEGARAQADRDRAPSGSVIAAY
jgi:hypothetical protein